MRNHQFLTRLCLLLFTTALVARVFVSPQSEFGDGREYVIQTQSIVFDRSLAIDPNRRTNYWNATNPYGVILREERHEKLQPSRSLTESSQYGGGYGSLYPDRQGLLYFAHPWAYSLSVAPVYAVLHAIAGAPLEYQAFRVANVALLFFTLLALWKIHPTLRGASFIALLLTSPITPHLQWAHAEIFCLACVLASFALITSPRFRALSPILLGVGAAQNIPIILFYPLHGWMIAQLADIKDWRRYLPRYLFGAALPLGMMWFYYAHFGVPNIISGLGQADISNITFRRLMSVLLSPQIGVWWYYPAAWFGALVSWRCGVRRDVLLTIVSCAAVATVSCATNNINSAQLSAPRYAVWFLAPLYFLPFWSAFRAREARTALVSWLVKAGAVVAATILAWLHTFTLLKGPSLEFLSTHRATPRVAALYSWSHFSDDVEPLVENIVGAELRAPHEMRGVYIWNLTSSSSMWIVTKRAAQTRSLITVTGNTEVLRHSTGIQSAFITKSLDGDQAVLALRDDGEFDRNPHWGGYRIIWVDGNVAKADGTVPVVVR